MRDVAFLSSNNALLSFVGQVGRCATIARTLTHLTYRRRQVVVANNDGVRNIVNLDAGSILGSDLPVTISATMPKRFT